MRKGEAHSAESRAKISASMKGKRKSEDTRVNMSNAATIRWAKERDRRRKLAEIMGIGNDVSEPRSISETFNTEGQAVA